MGEEKENKKRTFCPVCGSAEVIYAILGTTAQYYECKHCGYRGPIIVQDGKLAEKLKERYKAKENNQKHL